MNHSGRNYTNQRKSEISGDPNGQHTNSVYQSHVYDESEETSDHEEEENSSEDRWDETILDTIECKNVYIEEKEGDDNLPNFFDVNIIRKRDEKHCLLCNMNFSLLKKKIFCKYCGISTCENCCNNTRRLSKIDKRQYKVCDKCDNKLSNRMFIENMKNNLNNSQEMNQEGEQQIKYYQNKLKVMQLNSKKQREEWKQKEEELKESMQHQQAKVAEKENDNNAISSDLKQLEVEFEEASSKLLKLEQLLYTK